MVLISLALLYLPFITLTGGLFYMRRREQRQKDDARISYELTFPESVKLEQITDTLNAIRKGLGPTGWSGSYASMVMETLHTPAGIQYRLRIPGGSRGKEIYNQIEGHIGGVHIEELEDAEYPEWLYAEEYGTTNHDARLDVDKAAAASRTLLNSGQNLGTKEATMVQIVFSAASYSGSPATPQQQVRLKPSLLDLFMGSDRQAQAEQAAKNKEPNYLAIVRIAATAKTPERARSLVITLAHAVGSVDGRARFRRLLRPGNAVDRVNRAAVPYKYPAVLMRSELAAVSGWPIGIKAGEMAGLRVPPTRHMRADPAVSTTGVKLGVSTANLKRSVAIPIENLMTHFLALGKNGTGKSTTFEHLAAQVMQGSWKGRKMGLLLLDPHGDLTANILNLVPRDRLQDVVYVNPLDTEQPVGMNLLGGASASLTTSYLMGILEKLYGTGPLTGHVLRNTIYTVALHKNMTLYEVALALDDPEFRDEITRDIKDEQLKRYWTRYENLSRSEQAQSTEPVMRRLGAFLTPEFKGIFGQAGGLDMRQALATGKIVIVNLSQGKLGEKSAELLGAMTVALLWQAVQERANVPESERVPFFLLADEFHRFMRLPTSFSDILAEARKYRLSCCMATQSIGQISEVRNDVMVNARSKLLYELGYTDAGMVGRELGIDPDAIIRLPQYTAILSVPHAPPVTVKTLEPPEPVGLGNAAIAASRSQFGKPMEDIDLELAARRKQRTAPKRQRPKIGKED